MMFHNVLQVFHNVLQVFHSILQVFHDVLSISKCFFTMFSEARNDQPALSPIGALECRRYDRQSPQECRKSDPILNPVLNGNWTNCVPGRQFPKGSTYI